ncbi:22401_t:CDS:2 [Dentiscutata erythropus]|uniref:22401_t:CDS:1 n=1 Tax=Dentiscutata erythropus TaxID=1348616 RepID=A0A9N9JHY3_9GLOM|nr:22401_t:CDS:2 [Dentiscutata erythropus]
MINERLNEIVDDEVLDNIVNERLDEQLNERINEQSDERLSVRATEKENAVINISDEENALNELSEDEGISRSLPNDEVISRSLPEDGVVYRSLPEDRTAGRRLPENFSDIRPNKRHKPSVLMATTMGTNTQSFLDKHDSKPKSKHTLWNRNNIPKTSAHEIYRSVATKSLERYHNDMKSQLNKHNKKFNNKYNVGDLVYLKISDIDRTHTD